MARKIKMRSVASIRIVEQLALFVDNRVGVLATVCDALMQERIHIYALSMSDTIDHAVVRMIVSDSRRALAIFESHGMLVFESDVLMIECENNRVGLPEIMKSLAEKKVNIEYCYLASLPVAEKNLLILRVQPLKKVMRFLQDFFKKPNHYGL